jgi:SSS family solute:Na+ symporter
MRRMLLAFGLVYTLVAVTWGFAAVIEFPDLATGDLATPRLLSSDLVPAVLGIIVMVGILAAAVSTIDSILLTTLSSMVTRDVSPTRAGDARQLFLGKLVIPVIAVLAYLFAQLQLNLIAVLSVAASAGLLVMVPAIVGTFFWNRGTAEGAISGIVVGGVTVLGLELTTTRLLGQGSGVWGLVLSTSLFVGVSLATTPARERTEEFLNHVKAELHEHRAP